MGNPMHDEVLLNDLLAGRLDAAASAQAVRRLRSEPELREHLLDMIAVRAVLPAVIDSTALPADETCAAARGRFAERARTGRCDAATEEHLESCASCAVAYEVFALSSEGEAVPVRRRVAFTPRRAALAASFVAVAAAATFVGTRWFADGRAPASAGGSGGAANVADVSRRPGVRVVESLPAPRARARTDAIADIEEVLGPMRGDPARAEFVAAVDELVIAISTQDPERNPKYGRVSDAIDVCPEEIMWAIAEIEPDSQLRNLAYSLTRRGTSVSAGKVREAILRERALGVSSHDISLFARFVKAYGEVDKALLATELAAIRDDDFAIDPVESERRLQIVIVAAYTFATDAYVLGRIEDVAMNGAHTRAKACAMLHLTSRREAQGDLAGAQQWLQAALPYLTHPDDATRVFAELAFERHANPEWVAELTAQYAAEGRTDVVAALRKAADARVKLEAELRERNAGTER